jgi:hypothetical protein
MDNSDILKLCRSRSDELQVKIYACYRGFVFYPGSHHTEEIKAANELNNLDLNRYLAHQSALETLHMAISAQQSRFTPQSVSAVAKAYKEFNSKLPTFQRPRTPLQQTDTASQPISDVPIPVSDSPVVTLIDSNGTPSSLVKDLISPIVVDYNASELSVDTYDFTKLADIDALVPNTLLDKCSDDSVPQSSLPCTSEPALLERSSIYHQSLGPYYPLLIWSFTFILVFISSSFRTSNNPLKPFGQLIMIFDPGIRTPIR